MRGLIQRVRHASVDVDRKTVGAIDRGILLLLGIEAGDTPARARKLIDKIINYRIFPDNSGRMNASVKDIGGGILVVSQFTLVADTKKGLRPGFSSAASPDAAEKLYQEFIGILNEAYAPIATGVFGADMQVALVNDGPVTFLLET